MWTFHIGGEKAKIYAFQFDFLKHFLVFINNINYYWMFVPSGDLIRNKLWNIKVYLT